MRFIKTFEDHNQGEIPFTGKDPIHGKPAHVHLIDALESMDKKKNKKAIPKPGSYMPYVKKSMSSALEEYKKDAIDMDYTGLLLTFANDYSIAKNGKIIDATIWNKKFFDKNDIDVDQDDNQIIDDLEKYEPKEFLTAKGLELYDDIVKSEFKNLIEDFLERFEDESPSSGLINVYRAVSLGKDALDSDGGGYEDIYDLITKGYSGVGYYWSWKKGGETPYRGEWNHKDVFSIYGKVSPHDIDWTATLYKNAYGLRDEREIELKNKVNVQVYAFQLWEPKKLIELENPVIVPASKGNKAE